MVAHGPYRRRSLLSSGRCGVLLAFALTGLGCGSNGDVEASGSGGSSPAAPKIELTPAVLDFGAPAWGEPVGRTVTARNTGGAELELLELAIYEDDLIAEYDCVPTPGPLSLILQPAEQTEFVVSLHLADGEADSAELCVESNDTTTAVHCVQLISEMVGQPTLCLYPLTDPSENPLDGCPPSANGVDFGDVTIGNTVERLVAIYNGGTGNQLITIETREELQVTNNDLDDNGVFSFELYDDSNASSVSAFPLLLTPGETPKVVFLALRYSPSRPELASEQLCVDYDVGEALEQDCVPLNGFGQCPAGTADLDDDPTNGCECTIESEICDGLDNDCDGDTDEDFGLNVPCDGADADDCLEGFTVCNSAGSDVSCTDPNDADPELCDGVDND